MTTTPSLSLNVDTKGEAPIDVEQFDGHTPGPWKLNVGDGWITGDNQYGQVARMRATCVTAQWEADGHLIEDAPRILAELKSARGTLTAHATAIIALKEQNADLSDREAICCDACDRYFPREDMHFGYPAMPYGADDTAPTHAICEECQNGFTCKVCGYVGSTSEHLWACKYPAVANRKLQANREQCDGSGWIAHNDATPPYSSPCNNDAGCLRCKPQDSLADLRLQLASLEERNEALKDDLDRAHGAIRDALAQLDVLAEVEAQP